MTKLKLEHYIRADSKDNLTINPAGNIILDGDNFLLKENGDATFSGTIGVSGGDVSLYPFNDLVVGGTDSVAGFTLATTGAAQQATLSFADGATTTAERNAGFIQYQHNADTMAFGTANTQALILDASQNAAFSGDVTVSQNDSTGAVFNLFNDDVSILSGDIIGQISARGFDLNSDTEGARIEFKAAAAWDGGFAGYSATDIHFYTQSNNGTDQLLSPVMTLGSDRSATFAGAVGIGIDSQYDGLHIHQTNNSYLHLSNTTTGSGAGSGTSVLVEDVTSDFIINQR